MKNIITLLLFCVSLSISAQTIVDPADFPAVTNPDNTNFEFYTRKTGVNRKASFNDVRKRMLSSVAQPNLIAYTPTPTGNANNRGDFVKTAAGRVYYIDGLGNAIWLNNIVEGLEGYDNDFHAALNCIDVGAKYYASESNTMGLSPGTVRVRLFGGATACPE